MPNKFQKSVQEKQEAEEKRRNTPNPDEITSPASFLSIRDYLIPNTQRVAKNKTFYLDTAVVYAVKRVAQEQKVTESRLVNDILRGVLGL